MCMGLHNQVEGENLMGEHIVRLYRKVDKDSMFGSHNMGIHNQVKGDICSQVREAAWQPMGWQRIF